MRRRICASALTALCIAAAPMTVAEASTTPSARTYWGTLTSDQGKNSVPYLVYNGTAFFGVWYLQQVLEKHNMATPHSWNGKSLSLTLPTYHGTTSTTVNTTQISSAHSMYLDGRYYVDLSSLAGSLGWSLSYNASSTTLSIEGATNPITRTMRKKHRRLGTPVTTVGVTQFWGPVSGYQNTPFLRTHEKNPTNFFGVWYLEQLLSKNGYGSAWNFHNGNRPSFTLNPLPYITASGHLAMGSTSENAELIQYQNHWYVKMGNFMDVTGLVAGVDKSGNIDVQGPVTSTTDSTTTQQGAAFTVSGQLTGGAAGSQVAFLDSDGSTVTASVSGSGQFSATLHGDSARVMGVYSPDVGWVGKSMAVTAGETVSLDATQSMGVLSGQVSAGQSGASVSGVQVVLRNDLTHTDYTVTTDSAGDFQTAGKIPEGPYEVWTVDDKGQPVFVGQHFAFSPSTNGQQVSVTLPTLPTAPVVQTTHAIIAAETPDVTPQQLAGVANMFERIYQGDVSQLGIHPQLPIVVQLYGNANEYTDHFEDEGYSTTDAENYGQNSQAVSESTQSVSVNMDGLDPETGVNVLAHEFTHCLIGTISYAIPSWANEGIAWHQGITAELGGSPSQLLASSLQWNLWEDIVYHKKQGDYYSLGQQDALYAGYNVEAQDYFAVEQLIQQYTLPQVISYVRQIDNLGSDAAFQQTFGESFATFSSSVDAKLQSYADQTDKGFSATIRVLPGGPDQLLVTNPQGTTYWYKGVTPGATYTFACQPDGTVSTPQGLTLNQTTSDQTSSVWDIGAQVGGLDQGYFSVYNGFGLGVLVSETYFPGSSNDGYTGNAIEVQMPAGVQLVSIQPTT